MKESKKVRLILRNGFHYSGLVKEADEKFLILKDKFDRTVTIARDEIVLMEDLD